MGPYYSRIGSYPEGFVDGETMVTYSSPDQIPELIPGCFGSFLWAGSIAKAGSAMVRDRYSKDDNGRGSRNLL